MRLAWILFSLLLLMSLVIGLLLARGESAGGHGLPHAVYEKMEQAPPAVERHGAAVAWLGGALGVLQVLFFVACLALGLRTGQSPHQGKWLLSIAATCYAAVVAALMLAYWFYVQHGFDARILAMPVATAIMLLVIWPFPVLFVVLYIMRFDRWVVTPQSMRRFRQIVEDRRRRQQGAD